CIFSCSLNLFISLTTVVSEFWFSWYGSPRSLHSFPTRRSSDLIKDYNLPLLGEVDATEQATRWNNTIAALDGFVFITQEYNHSITGALKNALDYAREAWNNKAAGIVSYGSVGGARAAEHLRGILGELLVADVRVHPALSLFTDFVNGSEFKPQDLHLNNVNEMLDQLIRWSKALKTIR